MKIYTAIGHFRGSENVMCVSYADSTKKHFTENCFGNDFIPYAVLTESMLEKVLSLSSDQLALWDQVKKLTSNYRWWDAICDYILQCGDILTEKYEAAKQEEIWNGEA